MMNNYIFSESNGLVRLTVFEHIMLCDTVSQKSVSRFSFSKPGL